MESHYPLRIFPNCFPDRGHEFLIACPKYGEDDFSRVNDKISVERFTCGLPPELSGYQSCSSES